MFINLFIFKYYSLIEKIKSSFFCVFVLRNSHYEIIRKNIGDFIILIYCLNNKTCENNKNIIGHLITVADER